MTDGLWMDRLLVASAYDPIEILETLGPLLKQSSPVIIYSTHKEVFLKSMEAKSRHSNKT